MRLTGSRAYSMPTPVPKMPPGLVELMEDLTRDVLKNNPPDVYEFCAEHTRKLLEIRDGPSFKQPLKLEQKIARAQEKVRKRGDARWQKYLKEKEKEISHSKTTLEQEKRNDNEITDTKHSTPTIQFTLKPPIYPDLDTENVPEIEISHQPGKVPDLPVNIVPEIDIKDVEMDHKEDNPINKELNANIEQAADVVLLNCNEDKQIIIDSTVDSANIGSQHYEAVKEVICNPNKNNSIDKVSEIITKEEEQHIPTMEGAKCEEIRNNEALSDPQKNPDELKNKRVLVKRDSEILETAPIQEALTDFKNKNDKITPECVAKGNNSNLDIGNLVSTAVDVHNPVSGSSRDPSRNENYIEDIKDVEKKENDEHENYASNVEKADIPSKTTSPNGDESLSNTIIKENENYSIEKPVETVKAECINNDINSDEVEPHKTFENLSNDVTNTQDNKSVNENDKEGLKNTVVLVEEDAHEKLDNLKNCELTLHNTLQENIPSDGNHNFEAQMIHVNDGIKDNTENDKLENPASPVLNEEIHESLKETANLNPADALAALNDSQVHGEKISTSILDIHESRNTQDPIDNNIIKIRISQAAEALNNEVPLNNEENDKTSSQAELYFVPLVENEVNAQFMKETQNGNDTEEVNEAHLLQNSEHDSTPSTISLVNNTDDAHNAKTSDTIKSISIDDSTDGFDNTSLIESGTSETTDDVIQHSQNNNSMDLETAAVTIQKVFRSFLFKSRASTFDDNEDNISLDEDNEKKDELDFQVSNANLNKERRGISRMDTVLQTVNEEKSLSLSTDDSSTLSSAATTIQAHVRGFLVRNKLHSHKTASSNSLVISDGLSLDGDVDHKNKTILNIHIVPEGGNYLSRDESMLTSMELSLDGSPPSSLNLHPLGYDKNERRKQLKREDAIQSISPPSNNSGKLSEDVDSVKDMLITEGELQTDQNDNQDDIAKGEMIHTHRPGSGDTSPTNSLTIETVIEAHKIDQDNSDADPETPFNTKQIITKQNSDEMDVVTPFEDKNSFPDSRSTSQLLHSSEFHDIVLPTKVSRNDASVVSEFKNVLVYFLLWNSS